MTRIGRPPLPVVALAVAGALFLVLPLAGLLWRAPWGSILSELASPEARTALRLSLVTSVAATAVSLALGLPVAWVLARAEFPGRGLLRAVALLPLVLPPVVGGVALLLAFGRPGLVGQWLYEWFGLRLPFTVTGAVVAEAFVAMPFVILTAEAAFGQADRRYENAARTLGAGPFTVFRRVTLPLAAPALAAGAVLAWARALGEFGATITFAGNTPGQTRTLPLEVFLALESGGTDPAVALSLVLVAVSLVVLVVVGRRALGGGRWGGRPLAPAAGAGGT